jgi:glycosyltransferase involved in cell wall biosynthesis
LDVVLESQVANRVDVTIVVIAHNERGRAPRCIRSILDQRSDASFEVLLVDDGSTDGTADTVGDLVASDARLRVLRFEQNRGRGAARVAGVAAARGPVIGFVDADITLPPDWLERCLAELPGAAAVGGIAVPDGDATVVARITGALPKQVPGSMPITGNNVLFDAKVLRETGFDPRDRLGEDFRLANRLLRAGHRLRRIPGLVVRHEEGKTYVGALRWRFASGIDASSYPRELGRLRTADLVWLGWLATCTLGVGGGILVGSAWLLLPLAATVAAALLHAANRFRPRPIVPFLVACALDLPVVTAYLLGRTVGIPRFMLGRR